MIRQEVRNGVEFHYRREAGEVHPVPHHGSHGYESDVGDDNVPVLLLLEQRRIRRVVLKRGSVSQ